MEKRHAELDSVLADLGRGVGGIRGDDGHFRQDRRGGREPRLRDAHPHVRDSGGDRLNRGRDRRLAAPSAISARTYFFLVLSGLATGGSWLCYYRALKLGPASLVAPIDKMSVVLVALFAVLFLGEKLTPLHVLGVGLIVGGAILVAL
jgi:multidrug transporter EmrE-like cation transporter